MITNSRPSVLQCPPAPIGLGSASEKHAREISLLRKLSSIEAKMAYSHALLGGNTQVTNLLTVRGRLTRAAVVESMRMVVARYEILRCAIAEQDGDLWFIAGDGEPDCFVSEETLTDSRALVRALEDEVSRCVDPTSVLWRMHLAHEPAANATHLLFTQHHAINDAFTTQVLFRAVLAALDGRQEGSSSAEPLTRGVDAWASPIVARSADFASRQPIPFIGCANLSRRRTGIWIADLPDNSASGVTRLARALTLSTNAVLTGVFASAFFDVVGCEEADMLTAISLRNRLGSEFVRESGCFINVTPVPIMARAGFLGIATSYHETLRKRILAYTPAKQEHRVIRAAAAAMREARAFIGLGVTNSGVMDGILGASSHEILNFRPAVNRVGGNLGLILHVTKLRNRTSLTFTYPRPLMPDDVVARTADLIQQRLSAL